MARRSAAALGRGADDAPSTVQAAPTRVPCPAPYGTAAPERINPGRLLGWEGSREGWRFSRGRINAPALAPEEAAGGRVRAQVTRGLEFKSSPHRSPTFPSPGLPLARWGRGGGRSRAGEFGVASAAGDGSVAANGAQLGAGPTEGLTPAPFLLGAALLLHARFTGPEPPSEMAERLQQETSPHKK